MAKTLKENMEELLSILPESYTKETAGGLLRKNGVQMPHKAITQELKSKHSAYKAMFRVPALSMYNENLLHRAVLTEAYVQEQLTNVVFSATNVRARNPAIKTPLSPKRQEEYTQMQSNCDTNVGIIEDLRKEHNEWQSQVDDTLATEVKQWRALCKDEAGKLTLALKEQGLDLPKDFQSILQMHLEQPGGHELNANELNEMNLKGNLSHAETAVIGALKEANVHV